MKKEEKNFDKKGIMELPFGLIFSIFLIVLFLAVAIYAINYFLDLQKCTQINLYVDDLQNAVDDLWKGQKGQTTFSASLPSNIEKICFANLSNPANNNEDIYEELEKNYVLDANFYFYPGKYACGVPYRNINHIVLPDENPYCIDADEEINLEKDFYDTYVQVGN